ncbi:MAG: tetratricopeptide repeat protein [Sulfuritalea sp.]|jgi:tetratricopeptide (TPR) repeat protein|nr:tetratricopeptide repeat protein [Sulfuritalea sp.]
MTKKPDVPNEWSAEGLLDEIQKLNRDMPDRSIAFILGAGASITSGIPAGGALAQAWLKEIHLRQCLDTKRDVESWAAEKLEAPGFRLSDSATYYARIFELRFGGDPKSGYAALEAKMEDAEPSLGYSVLAKILADTRHKVVVTTNFDNLVADALAIHALQHPLIVGHESLTGFVRPQLPRPLVAKIHRDLHLHPKNDRNGVDTLDKGWAEALELLFQHYTPLVIGYGGNDGSLMGFLAELPTGHIPGRLFWCYREGDRPGENILDTIVRHNGVLVAIAGFDEFMVQLAQTLFAGFQLDGIAKEIENLGKERAKRYQAQADKLLESFAKLNSMPSTPAADKARQSISEVSQDLSKWWTWELRARSESDPDKRDAIYQQAIEALPTSAELVGNYASFLATQRKDYDAAEAMYKKALELDPNRAIVTGNYANFLADQRKDYDAAEAMYKKALELDPNHANNTGNYALFLAEQRKDGDAAEAMYKKALEVDPSDANHTGNYALFLKNQRKDYDAAEAMYKKALELDPNHVINTGNYAIFLAIQRKDDDAAEAMYKKALELDPSAAYYTGGYANFLAIQRKDDDAAEAMYKKALELDPNDANNTGNYASFLLSKGPESDRKEAKALVRRTVDLSVGSPSQTLAEALLYDCLISELTTGAVGASLGRLKALFRLGFERLTWDFSALFQAVLPNIAADRRDLYRALGDAILDVDKVVVLDGFPLWRQSNPNDPFTLD